MTTYSHTQKITAVLLVVAAIGAGLTTLLKNPEDDKINGRVNAYFNKSVTLDQTIRRISVQNSYTGTTGSLNGRVVLRDGDMVPFHVSDVISDGFEEMEAWCPTHGECKTHVTLNPDQISQPQTEELLRAIGRQGNAAVERYKSRSLVARNEARRSWNLEQP